MDFKNKLNKDYGFDYAVDVPLYLIRCSERQNRQDYCRPISRSIDIFNNKYGTGVLICRTMRSIREERPRIPETGSVSTDINDYDSQSNSFDPLHDILAVEAGTGLWLFSDNFALIISLEVPMMPNQQVNFKNQCSVSERKLQLSTASLGAIIFRLRPTATGLCPRCSGRRPILQETASCRPPERQALHDLCFGFIIRRLKG